MQTKRLQKFIDLFSGNARIQGMVDIGFVLYQPLIEFFQFGHQGIQFGINLYF